MKYQVRVFASDSLVFEQHEFTKVQEAHSYLVFQSRKLKGEFFRIVVCNIRGEELEIMLGRLARGIGNA
jgi:hypothetical protein